MFTDLQEFFHCLTCFLQASLFCHTCVSCHWCNKYCLKLKKIHITNYLINRLILFFSIVYFTVSGSIYLISLYNYQFISDIGQEYIDSSIYTESQVLFFLLAESLLHLLLIALLIYMWIKPKGLVFLWIGLTNLTQGALLLYVSEGGALQKIVFEWLLIVLIGFGFSALLIDHFIRHRKNQKAHSTPVEQKDEDPKSA